MQPKAAELPEDELLLTPPVVYGFSLSDKVWRTCLELLSSCVHGSLNTNDLS